ncbi:MAG: hypothetical protein KGL16_01360, partial [Acidobacteriota bacterium]|nr:hypothetical protein [Acidobacteriota bacterium]
MPTAGLQAAGSGSAHAAGSHGARATGSGAAQRLLVQAFAARHAVKSGVIKLDLRLVPNGSSSFPGPIELSFGGPFTSAGAGRRPQSDFTVAIVANGRRSTLQVIAAGGKGYITVAGQSYQIPAASLRRLESGFGALGSSGGSRSRSAGTFSKLGVEPLHWLIDPRITGTTRLNGVKTTRIRAALDAAAMIRALSTLLGKTTLVGTGGSSGTARPRAHSIPPATQRRIAQTLGSPSVEVWTGTADRLIRKLTVTATIPVTGVMRSHLGGLRSAAVTLDLEYSDLNQPQRISAPTVTQPFSVFRSAATAILQRLAGGLGNGNG